MLDIINKLVWSVATIFILFCGTHLTFSLSFVQLRLKKIKDSLKNSNQTKGVSPLKVLFMSLAGKVGVGSLAGIALAINIGGIGTIFWIWIFSILTSSNAFTESALGILYKEKDNNHYKGGPSYYIDKGLNKKKTAKIYAILVIIAYTLGFLTIQANTIVISVQSFLNIDKLLIGLMLAILTLIIIFKGLDTIIEAISKIIPIMAIIYLLIGLFIISTNINLIPNILTSIIKEALNFTSFTSGAVLSMIIGLQRGIFSSEAGLGTGAIMSGASNDNNATRGGYIQVLGTYFTTLIICTITAFIILTTDYNALDLKNINGIELTQYALNFHLGNFGDILLAVIIFLFAFSTILAVYYYGESNLKYLFKGLKEKHLTILKIIISLLVIYGSIASSKFLWNIIDIFVALLAIINTYAIFKLRKVVKRSISNDK